MLWIALAGLSGIFILLFSLQSYWDIRSVLVDKKDWLLPEYLIVNKRVSLMNSFNKESGFSEEEIKSLQAKPFVEQVFPFQSNQFKCAGMTLPGSELSPNSRYTDLFFESVPSEMLDTGMDDFTWQKGDELVPAIIPTDYLNLYNFGFAPGQGMPKLSAETLSSIRFRILIDSMGTIIHKQGRIVAFSNRIQSILVPQSFIEYGNKNYVSGLTTVSPSRLIVQVNNPMDPELGAYFESMQYESNRDQIKNSRLSSLLQIILYFLSGIALLIIVLSLVSFVQFWNLLILRNEYEVKTLLDLGLSPKKLRMNYLIPIMSVLLVMVLVSLLLVFFAKQILFDAMDKMGFVLEKGIDMKVLFSGLIIFVGLAVIQSFSLKKFIAKYFNPNHS